MACYHPLEAFKIWQPHPDKPIITFKHNAGGTPIKLPCGQCIGCRLERSRQWAIRCSHEASLYENNCFITLTYNDQNLPKNLSLDKSHFQKFMKRLRKRFGSKIRYYHCGEYGEQFGRPHYHACVFNFDFPDKQFFKKSPSGEILYTSKILEELWPYGYSSIGSVTFQSAAYVARYIMKKVNGKNADDHYETHDEYGVVTWRQPEYTTMSRRPGIGKGWFDKYKDETYRDDFLILNKSKMRPPRFYDNHYEVLNPQHFEEIKHERERNALNYVDNNTPERLKIREQVQTARLTKLKRTLT